MQENIIHTPILINNEYLAAYSPLPINYSFEEIRPFVTIAENIWLVDVLGKKLYQELLEQVGENEVTPENSTLLLKIYPFLAVAVCYEALPFIAYHFTDKGITKGKSDNSEPITTTEITNIQNHLHTELSVLKQMLKSFLKEHKDCYPLYIDDGCDCNIDLTQNCHCLLDCKSKRQYYKQLLKNNRFSRLFSNT